MQLFRSLRSTLLGVLLLVAIPGVGTAQWVLGGQLDELAWSEHANGPVIFGNHSDGATNSGLPGTWLPGGLASLSGQELVVAPGVSVFTQTLTTAGQ